MNWLTGALAVLLVAQTFAWSRERRRLIDLIVARHAPDAALLAAKPRRQRKDKTPAVPPIRLSEHID